MPMPSEDYELSMLISPRARRDADNARLRELHVTRLSDTHKAIGRAGLRTHRVSVYCEGCKVDAAAREPSRHHNAWTRLQDEFPAEWDCPKCKRSYRLEFAVYEEVDDVQEVEG